MKTFGREIFSCLVGLFLIVSPSAAYAVADLLDVEALSIKRDGAVGSVVEGQAVSFTCGWRVRIVDSGDYWHTKKGEAWPVRIEVDGKPIGNFQGTIAAGTCLGQLNTQSGIPLPGGGYSSTSVNCDKSINGSNGPASWVAAGPGKHQVRCVINQPKQVSDRNPGNNISWLTVDVMKLPAEALKELQPKPKPHHLHGQGDWHCEPKMDAWVELDTSGLNAADVKPAEKKKVTLPFFSSSPLFDSVACAYGDQKVNAVYLIKCKKAKRYADDPDWYHCEKQ